VVTGIDKSDASTVRYYPNPLSSVLTIEGLKPTIPVTLEIMDMLGKVCFSNEFVPSTDKTTFNTSELKKGMYILKLRSASLNTEGKIVVQ
jgi:hypothetical protein